MNLDESLQASVIRSSPPAASPISPFPDAARQELTDEQRYLRMPSRAGRRWKTIANLDTEIECIQGEQERLRTEAEMLNARRPAAETADVQALAN